MEMFSLICAIMFLLFCAGAFAWYFIRGIVTFIIYICRFLKWLTGNFHFGLKEKKSCSENQGMTLGSQ